MRAKMIKDVGRWLWKRKNTGLTIICVGSTLVAVYEAVKHGPTVKEKYEKAKKEGKTTTQAVMSAVLTPETAKIAVPTAMSVASVVTLNKVTGDTIRNLTDVATTAMTGKEIFEKAAEEVVGEEKVKDIREKAAKDSAPGGFGSEVFFDEIIPTGHGKFIFYDEYLRLWFYNDLQYMRKLVNDYNDIRSTETFVSAKDFYMDAGVPRKYLEGLGERGWNFNHKLEFAWDFRGTENDIPYYHMRWYYPPKDEWQPFHRY